MTGPYGRLNHFGHPDPDVRRYYVDWFRTFADISAELGASGMGTQFAIFTHRDYDDPERRAELRSTRDRVLARGGRPRGEAGLTYLFWEPMSVGPGIRPHDRELQGVCRRTSMSAAADPDEDDGRHRPRRRHLERSADIDPVSMGRKLPAPVADHPRQAILDEQGGHWPFTAAYNKDGRITPEKLLDAVRRGGGTDNEICLELSFREREPVDHQVVEQLRESVDFWAPFIDTGRNELKGFDSAQVAEVAS
jgi:hypothetical protein